MNKWLAKTLVGLGCFALLSAYALAFQDIDHSIYFPSVVQGHGSCSGAPNPQLIQYNSARINGTNNSVVDFVLLMLPMNGLILVVIIIFAKFLVILCLRLALLGLMHLKHQALVERK